MTEGPFISIDISVLLPVPYKKGLTCEATSFGLSWIILSDLKDTIKNLV